MVHLKYHWAIPVSDPSKCRNAWKAYTGGYYARACGRRYANASIPDSAADFVNRAKSNPDWYCTDCAKAARLALAAESAPKHVEACLVVAEKAVNRTDSDRYAELRKLVEAYQSAKCYEVAYQRERFVFGCDGSGVLPARKQR